MNSRARARLAAGAKWSALVILAAVAVIALSRDRNPRTYHPPAP